MNDNELVERVAVEVMGWTKTFMGFIGAMGVRIRKFAWTDSSGMVVAEASWNPLTTDADMGMVLAKVLLGNLWMTIETGLEDNDTTACWDVWFTVDGGESGRPAHATGTSMLAMKRAILRAALDSVR